MKPFLSISKTYILNVSVTQWPIYVSTLLTFEKHFNTQTKTLQADQLCSLGVSPWCCGTLSCWQPWVIPSYLLPDVPDIFVAHCMQSSFLDSVQTQRPRWGRRWCLTFDGGFVVSYLFSGSWRLMEKEGKFQGQCWNMKAIPTLQKIVKGRISFQC